MDEQLSIIIPARNEENRIHAVEKYISHFEKKYGPDFEVIVVTDTCTDKTVEYLSELCQRHPQLKNYNYDYRLNKGGAIAKGISHAGGDIITYTDVDCSTEPLQLDNLVDILKTIDCDAVIASRYSGGSKLLVTQTLGRRLLSRGFNLMVRSMFNLKFSDTQCGAKAFRKEVAKDIAENLSVTDWAFDVNLLYNAQKKGYDIREIPIVWEDRAGSRLNTKKVVPMMFLSLVRLRLLNSPFSIFVNNSLAGRAIKAIRPEDDTR